MEKRVSQWRKPRGALFCSFISSSRRADARRRVMIYTGGEPPLMIYAALRASMICQARGLDKKRMQNVSILHSFLEQMTGI